ncbi:hypothetical protein B0A50_05425 [Salinomyces thailandicus]|uniref:Uncharacterized protein n=1 Tax=Salinomyces thailandicus TaxID=706561 RepID=A0A4U0TTQ1_9PEZI|nr:hypothetical protein B0A50_05425 [Salinomyces thailandica]
MGLEQLPDELLLTLTDRFPCRDQPLQQLKALLSPALPSPSTLVVYGPHATGKSSIIKAFLDQQRPKQRHAVVQCRECITGRHLLERTVAAVREAVLNDEPEHDSGEPEARANPTTYPGRCETLSALEVHLQHLLENQGKFTLALDGVDKQRDAPPTLLPALARMGDMIPNLTLILIVQHPPPRFLHQTGVPHIHFPPYSRNQSLHVLSRQPPDIFVESPPDDMDHDDETHEEDKRWLWPRFCAAIWDSLAQNAARDLTSFHEVCQRLWRPFVAPIVKGDFGTRDFSRLVIAQRRLFQDESILLTSILSPPTPQTSTPTPQTQTQTQTQPKPQTHDLPYYAKWLLIAAYLASFNPARLDALYFMKTTDRKRRKKGGGTARTPTRRPSQTRKIPRHLLAPASFTLDRLLAILHAILPHDLRTTIDMYTQIATLTSLRLLVRSGGIGSSDPLEAGGKWRVGPAVNWEYAQGVARSLDFGLLDYVAE